MLSQFTYDLRSAVDSRDSRRTDPYAHQRHEAQRVRLAKSKFQTLSSPQHRLKEQYSSFTLDGSPLPQGLRE